jgi:hypothetical protein
MQIYTHEEDDARDETLAGLNDRSAEMTERNCRQRFPLRRGVHGWIVSVLPPGDELTRWEVHAVQLDVVLKQSAMTTTADRFLALVVEFGSEDGG